MKNNILTAIIYILYFLTIITAIIITDTLWPLIALVAMPSITYTEGNDE